MANTLPVSATQITVPAQNIQLTQEWDKIFPKSTKVEHRKVTFKNRFGITLVGDLYIPKNAKGKLPAITFSGPFGAVKEQTSGFMHKQWRSGALLRLPLTARTQAKVQACHAICQAQKSTSKIFQPALII